MADYDSDSSDEDVRGDDIQTNVLLGYASKEATSDDFSQLGGRPVCRASQEERHVLTKVFYTGLARW